MELSHHDQLLLNAVLDEDFSLDVSDFIALKATNRYLDDLTKKVWRELPPDAQTRLYRRGQALMRWTLRQFARMNEAAYRLRDARMAGDVNAEFEALVERDARRAATLRGCKRSQELARENNVA